MLSLTRNLNKVDVCAFDKSIHCYFFQRIGIELNNHLIPTFPINMKIKHF